MTGSLTVTWDDVITTIVGGTMVAGVEMRVTLNLRNQRVQDSCWNNACHQGPFAYETGYDMTV